MTLLISGRWGRSQLVRWCPEAKTYQPADEPTCNWEHSAFRNTITGHRLRLRRMLVCEQQVLPGEHPPQSVLEQKCSQAYFTKELFEGHECFSA